MLCLILLCVVLAVLLIVFWPVLMTVGADIRKRLSDTFDEAKKED